MGIGDIYIVEIPFVQGHEQGGNRPAIIMQDTKFETRLPTVIVVPLTSQLTSQVFPCTFLIQPDSENGLMIPSVALVFQIRAIDKKRLKQRIGQISTSHLSQIYQHINNLLQLPVL